MSIPLAAITHLTCDIETFSGFDLAKSGVYKYAESPDFALLLFSYSLNGGDIITVDLSCGETIPREVSQALADPGVMKHAFNATFERVCLSRHLGYPLGTYLDPAGWYCDSVRAAYLGLPFSLEGVGEVLGLEKQKLKTGRDLIRFFCQPCKPTAANNGSTRNQPARNPDKWAAFIAYNIHDVECQLAIQARLAVYPVPAKVWEEYQLDQRINDLGVALDLTLVKQALAADEGSRAQLTGALRNLTQLDNPNSVIQLKGWLAEQGLATDTLDKKAVAEMMQTAPEPLKKVLALRQQLAKSSLKKYQAMANAVCADGRARGMFQFYGANRTGRWAGRVIQVQNLPQNHLPDLDVARELLRNGDFAALDLLYDTVPEVLSELIRTAFVPKANHRFLVADFSAIEARILAWLAGETWRQQVFATDVDIYCASASQMFRLPVEKNGINSHLRQRGKISELALGYGGSVGALKAMGALDMGLSEDELQPLVSAWRTANPRIVQFWWEVDRAALRAVRERTITKTHGITFAYQSGLLRITLPSGRQLAYVKPRLGMNPFGSEGLTYEGVTSTKRWERIDTYGPKLVENIVQATSRDILAAALDNLKSFSIVLHIHDEIVLEADRSVSLDEICSRMSQTPPWANGLLLRAEGFACDFYQKK